MALVGNEGFGPVWGGTKKGLCWGSGADLACKVFKQERKLVPRYEELRGQREGAVEAAAMEGQMGALLLELLDYLEPETIGRAKNTGTFWDMVW